MLNRRGFLFSGAGAVAAAAVFSRRNLWSSSAIASTVAGAPSMVTVIEYSDAGKRIGPQAVAKVVKTDAEWHKQLSPLSFQITRQEGTEVPFSGQYNDFYKPGLYRCICCDNALYSSDTKYDPGEGWPSFWAPIAKENIVETKDYSAGMLRTKISCVRCDAHLGHVFDDGPPPTGLRYCMDSVALKFVPRPA
jgi:peptide-methionine (R)-S-oxide reductase